MGEETLRRGSLLRDGMKGNVRSPASRIVIPIGAEGSFMS